MFFFMSGISDAKTAAMLRETECYPLVDPTDLPNVIDLWPKNTIALDSGAYKNFKAGIPTCPNLLDDHREQFQHKHFCFKMALDTIGSPEVTYRSYRGYYDGFYDFTPVYPWGAPQEHLETYLARAPIRTLPNGNRSELVAIGGLAKIMRGGHKVADKKEKANLDAIRAATIEELAALCKRYPNRFHLLGLNSLDAIQHPILRQCAASADSSKWLDGGRYAYLFFISTKTGKLSQRPANTFDEPFKSMNREERCKHNAEMLVLHSK